MPGFQTKALVVTSISGNNFSGNAFEMKNLPAIFISRESSGRHSRSQRHQQIFNDNFPCSKFGILASFFKKKKGNQLKTFNKQ